MLRGDPIWQTSSTGPMSMPSSRDAVATSAGSSPARSRASSRSRRSLDRLPWWAATRPSPRRSPRRCASRSARRRVFTKMRVVRCARTCVAMRSRISPHCSWDATASSSLSGSSIVRSSCRRCPRSTIRHAGAPSGRLRPSPAPTRRRAIVSMGRWVAESPMRWGRCFARASRRSSVRARCDPRLSRATAWISSTITVRTLRRRSRLRAAVTRRYSDSGVVIRRCGGCRSIAARALGDVSPVRATTRTSGTTRPSSRATSRISASGRSRFSRMSAARALSGDT